VVVDKWLAAVGIEGGPVFRGIYKGGKALRLGQLSLKAIKNSVGAYPIAINEKMINVSPHAFRRTYARRLYVAGVVIMTIK
jgi:integrase